MTSAAADRRDREVSIGRIFSRAFGTVRDNPVATLGIAFLFNASPSLAILYTMQNLQGDWLAYTASLRTAAVLGFAAFSFLVYLLLWTIAQGALVRATTAFEDGLKAGLGESIMASLRAALPLLLLGLLTAVALSIGFVILIVPGFILYLMWAVAAPALIEERLGPIEALRRSHYLTRGNKWKIFGLTLVLIAMYLLFALLVGLVAVMAYGGLEEYDVGGSRLSPSDVALHLASSTIASGVGGVIHCSLYIELRDCRDGPRTEALADIFG